MNVVINSHVVLSRVPEGPIAPYLGRFADSLDATGYAVKWIHRQVLLGSDFSRWLGQKSVALQDIASDHLTRPWRSPFRTHLCLPKSDPLSAQLFVPAR